MSPDSPFPFPFPSLNTGFAPVAAIGSLFNAGVTIPFGSTDWVGGPQPSEFLEVH